MTRSSSSCVRPRRGGLLIDVTPGGEIGVSESARMCGAFGETDDGDRVPHQMRNFSRRKIHKEGKASDI